jgi:hypothetical protein
MNHKIASILKTYIETLSWADKVAGLVQTANIRVKNGDTITNKAYPVSCDISEEVCLKGAYQDLAPDSKKKSVIYFEDLGVNQIERQGNKLKFESKLRLVCWLNYREIQREGCDSGVVGCGTSGDYVIELIKVLPTSPISTTDFVAISVSNITQVIRSEDIFSKYTYAEHETQYLMFPFDYFALDLTISFTIPCS